MAFERISSNFQELKENAKAFAQSSAEYYKLDLFNKSMHGAIAAIKGVAIALFMFFFILFISIALAVALSNWIDSPSSGFFIVAGIYLLLVLFFVFFGSKVLMKAILPKASKKFFEKADKEPVHEEHHEFHPQKDLQTDEIIIKDNKNERV